MPLFPRWGFGATLKKYVPKKLARLFFCTRKLLNNFFNINVIILGFGTVNRSLLRMFESKYEMLTPEFFFQERFFPKYGISPNLGHSRALSSVFPSVDRTKEYFREKFLGLNIVPQGYDWAKSGAISRIFWAQIFCLDLHLLRLGHLNQGLN